MHANIATIEILLDENGSATRAVARLHSPNEPGIIGTGIATRNPRVANSSTNDERLATAQALLDLAEQLFAVVNSAVALPSGWSY